MIDNDFYLRQALFALKECGDLMESKNADYNHSIEFHEYFPYGLQSAYTMMHIKLLRYRSAIEKGSEMNYESAEDSLKDLINYAARTLAFHEWQKQLHKEEDL